MRGLECRKTRPTSYNESTPLGFRIGEPSQLSEVQGSRSLTPRFSITEEEILVKLFKSWHLSAL